MALLVIRTDDGHTALIHSSQIGPAVTRRETAASRDAAAWRAVWRRLDAAERKENAR